MFVLVLPINKCQVFNLEHTIVAIGEEDAVRAVDQHHVPSAVGLPGDFVWILPQILQIVSVHGDWL